MLAGSRIAERSPATCAITGYDVDGLRAIASPDVALTIWVRPTDPLAAVLGVRALASKDDVAAVINAEASEPCIRSLLDQAGYEGAAAAMLAADIAVRHENSGPADNEIDTLLHILPLFGRCRKGRSIVSIHSGPGIDGPVRTQLPGSSLLGLWQHNGQSLVVTLAGLRLPFGAAPPFRVPSRREGRCL